MPSITMTIDQLRLSPHNVRTNREDQFATEALERSLLANGLMLPLLVHPMRGRAGQWGVFAGGRRYRALKRLVDRGDLPADHAIDVVVRDLPDAELTEASLSENLLRRDLRPYEIFAAVLRASSRGEAPEQIAKALGQELIWVKQALRLATLAPPLLVALETERLSVEQARAFGATDDHAAQVAVWKELCGTGDMLAEGTTPELIRKRLKIGDPELQKLLRFVGDDAYRAAKGRFQFDLFTGQAEQRGRVMDESILRDLVDVKLGEIRAEWRASLGREVRFQAHPPQNSYRQPDLSLEIEPTLNAAEGAGIELPAGDVVGTIEIGAYGAHNVRFWWASAAAKRSSTAPKKTATPKAAAPARAPIGTSSLANAINDAASPGVKREADAAIKEDTGLGQDSVEIMRTLRRAVFRAALIGEARNHRTWAIDYFVWAQLRMKLGDAHEAQVGMKVVGEDRSAASMLGHDIVQATPAYRLWQDALGEIRRSPVINSADLEDSFAWYSARPPAFKRVAEAIVAGLAMERTLGADGYDLPVPALIAANIGLNDELIRCLWQPSPELLARIPRADQLAIAEPFLERVTFGAWQRLKAPELTDKLHELLTGAGAHAKASMSEAARRWVHPLLGFGVSAPVEQPELAEAAE